MGDLSPLCLYADLGYDLLETSPIGYELLQLPPPLFCDLIIFAGGPF